MAKGGARARSGPPPDPDSLTQTDGEWTVLPASGREGDAPAWPLVEPTTRELELWADEWTRPQAVMWERERQEIGVAMYVRVLVEAEKAEAKTNTRTLLKQLREELGLSMPGLLRNRWRIGDPEEKPSTQPTRPSARDRLTVVPGGA